MLKRINDKLHYRITLKERAEIEGATGKVALHPGREYTVRGDVLKTIKTSVSDAKPV